MSRPRLLITGAGGFCGEHACRYFSASGWDVTALVRRLPSEGESSWLEQASLVLDGDLILPEEADDIVAQAQPEYVLHLAGKNAVAPSWVAPIDTLQSNVMGTVNLLEAVRKLAGSGLNCRVLVVGSMLRFHLPPEGTAPVPPHPYSLSKTMQVLAAQSWSALYGMPVVVAEPSNLIGPGRSSGLCTLLARYAAMMERAEAGCGERPQPMKLSSRTETRDVLDVRDAIRAYELLLLHGHEGGIYPVASGVMHPLGELADIFSSLIACPLEFDIGSSDAPSPLPVHCQAVRSLGWSPAIPLRQSLEDVLNDARRLDC
ncbi:NAD-dependent epimerase/dehydratase family protein [Paenibacillus nasutitermitis]|uniref:UDP-2-acetamido-2,6-dideoxy-hexulose 4-reductase n=1 Tax=Paenibacillus nasutitermitis TaxID=1652958 RepID=A0A916YKF5_9BACL|nr:NAD-dependent epimerase/dehydratase family protein [Paenibacillus nasutitermitis]GGD49950.1 UDP-2-acetamido-2,6-dideoxy-hexulose 4-reductase [Paenibacillus nasutitermitis]